MTRPWKDVKADKAQRDLAMGRDLAATRAEARDRTEAYVLGYRHAQFREETGLSQTELAAAMCVSQPRASQLERGR